MKRRTAIISCAVIGSLLAMTNGCILKKKVLDIVINNAAYVDFHENHDSGTFTTSATIPLGPAVDEALSGTDYSRSDIKSARIVSGSYGVLEFSHDHDWKVSGSITVERVDEPTGTVTLIAYDAQSIQEALGEKILAPLTPAGVSLLNQALEDFIGGKNPVLTFAVVNSDVNPNPSTVDPIVFDWRAWIVIQVIAQGTFDVPDPF
jgi:hypothetical protein